MDENKNLEQVEPSDGDNHDPASFEHSPPENVAAILNNIYFGRWPRPSPYLTFAPPTHGKSCFPGQHKPDGQS